MGGGRKFSPDMGYTIDHLTALMLVIVTTVAVWSWSTPMATWLMIQGM